MEKFTPDAVVVNLGTNDYSTHEVPVRVTAATTTRTS